MPAFRYVVVRRGHGRVALDHAVRSEASTGVTAAGGQAGPATERGVLRAFVRSLPTE